MFSLIHARLKKKEGDEAADKKVHVAGLLPWFIVGFLAMAGLNSVGLIPVAVSAGLKRLSKFLMVAALAAIGLNTDFRKMKKAGINPMIHGFIISALVVIVALLVEMGMGIV